MVMKPMDWLSHRWALMRVLACSGDRPFTRKPQGWVLLGYMQRCWAGGCTSIMAAKDGKALTRWDLRLFQNSWAAPALYLASRGRARIALALESQ